MTDEEVEVVARAMDGVRVFSRWDDWSREHVPGYPIEICRYGNDDEPEIVVLERWPADVGEDDALARYIAAAGARAAIVALDAFRKENVG